MKVRHAFVSNSSSASFTIPWDKITKEQMQQLADYDVLADKLGLEGNKDWSIELEVDGVHGYVGERAWSVNMRAILRELGLDGVAETYGL